MAGRLEGRVAIITGGASGIGRACAETFAREGADIVIGDLDEVRVDEVLRAVAAMGRKAAFVRTDTSQEADCEALAEYAEREFGRIDALVAAAGISHALYVSGAPVAGDAPETPPTILTKPTEYWEKVLNVNLTGVMMTDRAVARRMIAAGRAGSIVNIASVAAKVPLAGAAEYCVSKAGVHMLTKVLAMEIGHTGVRVNAIGPGFIETPMTANMRADESRSQLLLSRIPSGRFGQAQEIANTALFLASDESSYFTGEILFPSGGLFVS
ncbi:MAG: NAD(P)-dependent oxidoreductase [Anaerolinea sp.]|nr:NAD(P)-dependent oxidoreductase [Anaerolinea sp.]